MQKYPLAILGAWLALAFASVVDAQTAAAAKEGEKKEAVVQLSPFEVSGAGDRGYYGANTMSGTRLNSRIEDLASSMTVVTKEQMADFAMLDLNDIFGLGNASGTVNSVPATANLSRDRSQVQFRADSYDGYRGSLDLNRVLKPGVLALRGSAVYQHDGFVRTPSGMNTVRLNGMIKYQPFKSTTVTASYSIYRMGGNRPNTTPPRDAISFWRESRSPRPSSSTPATSRKVAGSRRSTRCRTAPRMPTASSIRANSS